MGIECLRAGRLVAIVATAAIVGCSSEPGFVVDAGGRDVSSQDIVARDAAPDGSRLDAAVDAPVDVRVDVRVDVASDQTTPDVNPGRDVVVSDGWATGDGGCGVSSAVADHVTAMATMGWGARNAAAGVLMYGCSPGMPASACLATVPTIPGGNVAGASLRLMYASTGSSNYWMRTSPDGRFAAREGTIHDFVRGVEITGGGVDPGFFPDNSRFVFPGLTCPMSVLTTGDPTFISGSEPGCSESGPGVYEHLAVALEGGDYWATSDGSAAWDDGGHSPTLRDPPPNSPWTAGAEAQLSLMANTGTSFTLVSMVGVPTPYQGDAVISPSSQWMMTRLVDSAQQQTAYVLYSLQATHTGGAIVTSLTEIARYCTVGAKPVFSLDERWMVTHHYVTAADATDLGFTGPTDPGFAPYLSQGASNIYLLDLLTGRRTRLTSMPPGEYAMYPTFRGDDWIYFLTRTLGTSAEQIVATDAALVLGP